MKVRRLRTLLVVGVILSSLAFVMSNAVLLPRAELASIGSAVVKRPFTIKPLTVRYGFILEAWKVTEGSFVPNQSLSTVFASQGVSFSRTDSLVKSVKPVFDIRRFQAGKPYLFLSDPKTGKAHYFIYEPNVYSYIIFDLTENAKAWQVKRPTQTQLVGAGGEVKSSLWDALVDNNISPALISNMEDALKWSVDFYRVKKGDQFKVIYEQTYVEGKPVDVGRVHAAYFRTGDKDFYSIYFDDEEFGGYYDIEGRPMRKSFLKAPVKYIHITSGYNLRRLHPILQYVRPHLGTDYSAPYGTPIFSVSEGVVLEARYAGGNGNYVKIQHDATYQTAYLHMSKFAAGIRPGTRVKQGEVIGYVGSTGLSTGPHVCFRFFKNGQQVNHLTENLPPPAPVEGETYERFKIVRDSMRQTLAQTEFRSPPPAALSPSPDSLKNAIIRGLFP